MTTVHCANDRPTLHSLCCLCVCTVIESPTGDCEPLYKAAMKAAAAASSGGTESTATAAVSAAATAAAIDEIEEQCALSKLPTIGILINREEALPPLTVLTRQEDLSLSASPATGMILRCILYL